jgi:PAS domain S-box-containing protein
VKSETSQHKPAFLFLQGGGEMGERIRNFNWSETSIGDPDSWPQSLRTTVSLLLHSQFPMFVWWGKELVTIYNDSYRVIAGDKHPHLLGSSGRQGWSEIWDDLAPLVKSVFSGHSTWSEDMILNVKRHGFVEETYFTFSYSPIMDESGGVEGLFCACIETTEKVVGRKKLQMSEARFRRMIDHATVAIALTSGREMIIESINAPMLQLMDREEDIIGSSLLQVLPELKNQPVMENLYRVHDEHEVFRGNEIPTNLLINGIPQRRYHNIDYIPLEQEGGETNILHIAIDVTAQVEARQKTEQSEQRFQNLIREASVGVVVLMGEDLVVSVVNAAYSSLINYTVEELLNKPLFDIVPEGEKPFRHLLDNVRLTGDPVYLYDTPYQVFAKGKKIEGYLNVVYQPYREADGKITGVTALVYNVTEQVEARQKLLEANEQVRLAIEAAGLGTVEVNLQTDEVIISKRMEEIFEMKSGTDPQALISNMHPDDLPLRQQAYEKAFQNGQLEYEARVMRKDGSFRWIRAKGRVYFDDAKKPLKLVSVVHDITEQKLFTEELGRQVSERTAALETMNKELQRSNAYLEEFAHAASHDLKEPIRKIHFFTDRLKKQLSDKLSTEDERIFSRVEHAAQRMNSLIDDLLLYSHVSQKPHEKEIIDLDEKIKKVLEDLELEVQEKDAIIKFEKLPFVRGYRRQLQQLFQNLLSNALKYSRLNVRPLIEISAVIVNGSEAGLPPEKNYHRITVSDNGIGFEKDYAEKIFQMFQRLHGKHEYEGTGVGLSIARKVAENHDGKITAEGIPGQGARFHVYLPTE